VAAEEAAAAAAAAAGQAATCDGMMPAAGAGAGAGPTPIDQVEDMLLPMCHTRALLGHLAAAMDCIRAGHAGEVQVGHFRGDYKVTPYAPVGFLTA
jgi:hypothetical protein